MVQGARFDEEVNSLRVTVIDGPLPADLAVRSDTGPELAIAPEDKAVAQQLLQREPIFHRPEFGVTRADFEKMTAPEFWETGASGRRYSRDFVLETLEKRYASSFTDTWEICDFHCAGISANIFLVTYTLTQGTRVTRRSTIWRRVPGSWQIVYHQGTPCPAE